MFLKQIVDAARVKNAREIFYEFLLFSFPCITVISQSCTVTYSILFADMLSCVATSLLLMKSLNKTDTPIF